MIEVTAAALAAHPFLHGMSRDHLAVLADAASDVTFPARHRLFEDGARAVVAKPLQATRRYRLTRAQRFQAR
jgi:hypothetical protein